MDCQQCQVTAWKFSCPFFSIFCLAASSPRQLGNYWETNVRAGRIVLRLKSVIWHCSASRFDCSQGGILDDDYFRSHPLFICSDHVWNQSYWTQEYLAFFLMKVFVKLFVNQLRLKETISWLRLNYREFMNWTNGRIIQCIMFGAWIQWIYKGLLWEDSGPSGNSRHSPWFSSAALKDVKPCLGILKVPRGINPIQPL